MSLLETETLDCSHGSDKTSEHPEKGRVGDGILILWIHEVRGTVV